MVGSLDWLKRRKLRFFEGLLALYRATGDLRQALAFLGDRLGSTSEGQAARQSLEELQNGRTLTEAMTGSLPGLNAFERGLLEVGEQAGNLEESLEGIVREIQSQRAARLELIARLAYPIFILHAAGLALVLVRSFWSGFPTIHPLAYFALLYAPALLGWAVVRHARTRPALARVLLAAPLLGPWLKDRQRSRFAFCLGQLYTAGIPISRALEVTATGMGPGIATEEVQRAAQAAAAGQPLAAHLPASLEDPILRDAVSIGEKSGSLTEELSRAHRYYRDQADRGLGRLVRSAYAVAFGLAVLVVVYVVVSVYGAYFSLVR
ncbi:MAG: type II secretion system F family protein [Planctomycetes bacterium]|nr:type II secretion system F family protein [Planctomycetota bacterium]